MKRSATNRRPPTRPASPQEAAAILAGLHLLSLEASAPQHLPGLIYDAATRDGKLRMLNEAEIERLLERVHAGGVWLGRGR